MNILHLAFSPRGLAADSYALSSRLVAALCLRHPGSSVTFRNIAQDGLLHIDADYARAMAGAKMVAAPAGTIARSDRLIEELEAADIVVIGTPMHNLTVPSTFKAWIDHVVRMHRTMRLGPEGKVGALSDRPTYIAITSGGIRTGAKARQPDFLEPYLRAVLPMIGIKNITVFSQEGTALAPESAERARADAWEAIDQYFTADAKAA